MGKKILVVDDEAPILTIMQARLKANGYEVITAMDGQEGLHKARSEKPDLIILDVMLPKMDGYRVAQILKLDDQFKQIPIMMCSAKVQDDERKAGMQVGANAYLTKPFQSEVLLNKVKELLGETSPA
ncbi:MAG: response regulator [Candidatus Omnitrophota bacterium]|nr:response regulator [Candidatus Omnitrophota bacterium]